MPMRCHKLRFGGGEDTGSLGADGELGVDATEDDMAVVEGLLHSDSSELSFGPLPPSAKAPSPVCSSSFSSHSSMLLRLSRHVGSER